jgi:hypothetical protein
MRWLGCEPVLRSQIPLLQEILPKSMEMIVAIDHRNLADIDLNLLVMGWIRALSRLPKKSTELACAEFGCFCTYTCWSPVDL